MTPEAGAIAAARPAARAPVAAAFAALRPRQWSKNLLLFAGIIFAAKIGDAARWTEAVAAFAAYCAASSAAYLANDVADAERDRAHPTKRNRPVARGDVSTRTALALAAALATGALAVAGVLGTTSLAFMLAFLGLQAAYSTALKHAVVLDVATIAALFVIRAAAGAEAVDVRISAWLLVCTALLALFLALAKRRAELLHVGEGSRAALGGYSVRVADRALAVTAGTTVAAYAIYALAAHTPAMLVTVPFVTAGLMRYLVLVHRRDLGEEPEEILLTDRPLVAAIAAWALVSAVVLAA